LLTYGGLDGRVKAGVAEAARAIFNGSGASSSGAPALGTAPAVEVMAGDPPPSNGSGERLWSSGAVA
jgi:hypothetical protein